MVRETRVPQAVSERLISRFAFREVLRQQAAHIVLVDLAWTGGISEARRMAELADTYHLPFAPHDCTGPVTALANLHLATAQPNSLGVEVVRGFIDGYYREVLDKPIFDRPWPAAGASQSRAWGRFIGRFPRSGRRQYRFIAMTTNIRDRSERNTSKEPVE